ncbi:class II fructose-bisphosphate aldolase [Candidatus Electrothrix sp.]|uniref:class II fructose-bisphosphate aldolase n=1 Tax=Candidatus Electrothrix sp. TaxID=2170559 RepID=UPI0040565B53
MELLPNSKTSETELLYRLKLVAIQKIVKRYPDVHLVLHGADNLKSDEIRMVIESGIKKINFGPKYRMSYLESLRRHSAREDDPRIVKENVIKDLSECVNNYCIQCGI